MKSTIGSIKPENWLKVCIERQVDELMGDLGEISARYQKDNNE